MTGTTVAISHQYGEGIGAITETWAQELLRYARDLRYNIIDCAGSVRHLEATLIETKPSILFNFYPAKLPANLEQLSNMAVVDFSSNTVFQSGVPVFVGFSKPLIVVSDNCGLQDIFKETFLSLAKRILDGWEAGRAVNATYIDLKNTARKYRGSSQIAVPLYHNTKALTIVGDLKWKLCLPVDCYFEVS